ncbi:MAG: preprotein translocase subunit SecG [Bacteroidetes bacterium]|jgi:preprotein translocase subunit SecG|nr:preprotein translocase subunit SecG [Bacteroidota bacterium]
MNILSILILIVCVLLVLVVLVQNSKGGGLASGFSSNNQIMGVRRTTDFLEKATWGLAGALLVLSLMAAPKSVAVDENGQQTATSATQQNANPNMGNNAAKPVATPTAQTPPAGK